MPISRRKAEFLERPEKIELLERLIGSVKEIVKSSREHLASRLIKKEDNLEGEPDSESLSALLNQFDENATTTLETVVTEVEIWLKEKITKQEELKLWEEPVLLVEDVERKGLQIQETLRKILLQQAKSKGGPKTSSKTTSSTSSKTQMASVAESVETTSTASTTGPPMEERLEPDLDDDIDETLTTTTTSTIMIERDPEPTTMAEIRHEEL